MRKDASLIAALALAAAACGGTGADTSGTIPPPGGSTAVQVPVGSAPVRGPADAWVTIVEFSDFQCPYCASVQPTLSQVLPAYGANVRLVFKHFPLSFHAYARPTAIASECAHDQGKFWEFHDLVFANRTALLSSSFESTLASIAGQAGVDVAAWQACRTDAAIAARVDADRALGEAQGISGTPTFVVNGVLFVGSQPAANFQAAIDSALAKAKASGIPADQYYEKAILGR